MTVWDGDAVTQGALADFLAEGHHAAHVKRATKVYRARRAALLDGLDGLTDWLEVIPSAAGLHVCTLLREPALDDTALDDTRLADTVIADAALDAGVYVEPLSVRHIEQPPRHGLAFGVGGIPLERIAPALAVLGQRAQRSPAGTPRRRMIANCDASGMMPSTSTIGTAKPRRRLSDPTAPVSTAPSRAPT